jgi:hypothetical protein
LGVRAELRLHGGGMLRLLPPKRMDLAEPFPQVSGYDWYVGSVFGHGGATSTRRRHANWERRVHTARLSIASRPVGYYGALGSI